MKTTHIWLVYLNSLENKKETEEEKREWKKNNNGGKNIYLVLCRTLVV